MFTRIAGAAALSLTAIGVPCHAGTGSEGYFTIFNNTAGNVIVGF